MRAKRFSLFIALFALAFAASVTVGQENKSWSSSSQQGDPSGAENPYRTSTTHTEVNGHIIDKTIVEVRGPDGRYVPYSQTERESVKINDSTVRTTERSYGTDANGQRVLTQQTQEEKKSSPSGDSNVVRTVSNPDANGSLQVVQQTLINTKQIAPGSTDTNTTVLSANGSGGLSPSVRIEEHQRQTDPKTTQFTKSTSLSNGSGGWNLSEVRQGTMKQDASGSNKEESVLRPDADGKLAVVERTVTSQADSASGEKRDTTETYSTNVPGQAGDEGLKLVKRESTVQRKNANGASSTIQQVERPDPGDPSAGLRVTQQDIDIVRPGSNGVAQQTSTIVTTDANGNTNTVWVDMGQSNQPPPSMKVDTPAAPTPAAAPKKK